MPVDHGTHGYRDCVVAKELNLRRVEGKNHQFFPQAPKLRLPPTGDVSKRLKSGCKGVINGSHDPPRYLNLMIGLPLRCQDFGVH